MSFDQSAFRRVCCVVVFFGVCLGSMDLTAAQDQKDSTEVKSGDDVGTRRSSTSTSLSAIRAPQDKEKEPALRRFMRQKLDASNKILEGLVTDDLTLVVSGSDVLLKMSHEEKWRISNDMLYRRYSREFIDAVADMKEKAAANSIDGTSLAWITSTMSCLKCHEWVRNTIIAENANAQLLLPRDEIAALRLAVLSSQTADANAADAIPQTDDDVH